MIKLELTEEQYQTIVGQVVEAQQKVALRLHAAKESPTPNQQEIEFYEQRGPFLNALMRLLDRAAPKSDVDAEDTEDEEEES